jgi:hypothetical protein
VFGQTSLCGQHLEFFGVNLTVNSAFSIDDVPVNGVFDSAIQVLGDGERLDHQVFQFPALGYGSGFKFLGIKPALI